MDLTLKIFDIALKVIVVMMCYRYLYLIVGFFGKAKVFPEAKKEHTYAVVICARNEEKVIGNLLDSIAAQRYPKDKLRVFVIADNCTDATAAIARAKRAQRCTSGTTPRTLAKAGRSNSVLIKYAKSSA